MVVDWIVGMADGAFGFGEEVGWMELRVGYEDVEIGSHNMEVDGIVVVDCSTCL